MIICFMCKSLIYLQTVALLRANAELADLTHSESKKDVDL